MGLSPDQHSYTKTFYIPYPECDLHNEWKLSYLMRAVQQIASDQLDALELPFDKLFAEGMVFLLSREHIIVHKPLKAGEKVTVTTWPVKAKGAQFRRTILITDETGERMASIFTGWTLADPVQHKILRPSAFPYTLNVSEPAEEGEEKIAGMRPIRAETLENGISLEMRYSNTDCNRHLNNAVYGDLALDCLPLEVLEQQRPSEFYIQFSREARYGSRVDTKLGKTEDGWYICGLLGEENSFEANLKLTDR